MKRGLTGSSGFQRLKLKGASTPLRSPSPSFLSLMNPKRSTSTKKIFKSIPTGHPAQAASTSIERIPPFESPTFQQGPSLPAKKSGASTRIKKKPCAFSNRASLKKRGGKPQPKCQHRAPAKLEAGIGRKESGPTIFLKTE